MLRIWRSCAATKRILSVTNDASVKGSTALAIHNEPKADAKIQTRKISKFHNNRNNEGFLNKGIRYSSAISRSAVTATAGTFDRVLGTKIMPKIFSYQTDFVKVKPYHMDHMAFR